MKPPEPFRPFGSMSEAEAESPFQWFVGCQAERVALLRRAAEATGESPIQLDGSLESLSGLWNWLRKRVEVLPDAPTQSDKVKLAGVSNRQLSSGSLALAVDTGFYLARILQSYSPKVQWNLWLATRDYYYQRPVLVGFGAYPLVPHDPVIAGFWRSIRGESRDDELIKALQTWMKKVTK